MAAALPIHDFNTLAGDRSFAAYLREQRLLDAEIRKALRDAVKDAEKIMAKLGDDKIGSVVRKAQYRAMRSEILKMERSAWSRAREAIFNSAPKVRAQAAKAAEEMLSGMLKRVDVTGDIAEGMEAAARAASERLEARLASRIELSKNVYKNQALSTGKIDQLVNNGITLGKSAKEIADSVIGYISPYTPGGQSYAAFRLGRTELNNTFHAMSVAQYSEHPWVRAVQWRTSGSHPRPDECDDFANTNRDRLGPGRFKPENVPAKPHPQCLCNIVPVTVDDETFLRELLGGKYNSFLKANGQVPI